MINITIYTLGYNVQLLLPFFIKWYRARFPLCNIIFYDNESNDNTKSIALENNCEVRDYITYGFCDFQRGHDLKNNCWKNSETDWVLICDIDEMLDIRPENLQYEQNCGHTIITSASYQMVNMQDSFNFDSICYGIRDPTYDKILLFNRKQISEINYTFGSHTTNIIGKSFYSANIYNMYHYRFINPQELQRGYMEAVTRIKPEDFNSGFGIQYLINDEDSIKKLFQAMRSISIKLF